MMWKQALAFMCMAGLFAGCQGAQPTAAKAAPAAKKACYTEVWLNGNTLVCGYEESVQKVLSGEKIEPSQTCIGKGPGGTNVVFEIDPANPALLEGLKKQYGEKHKTTL